MKLYIPSLFMILVFISACRPEKKFDSASSQAPEPDLLKKVALAHGYEHWKNVSEINFTFNVDRDTMHFERQWKWNPGTQDVTLVTSGDTIMYNRKAVDSSLVKYDSGFINDKFWFLAPYQLVWDEGSFTYEHTDNVNAPISGTPMQKLTIVYANEGGYTPGDAYDLYLDEKNMVREWTFRKANKPAPGSDATWEGYENVAGLMVSTKHKIGGGAATLYFTGVDVKTKP